MQLGFINKSFIPKLVVVVGICGFLYGFFSNRITTHKTKTKTYWFHVRKNIESKVKFDDKLETTIEQVDTETLNNELTNNESTNNESTNNEYVETKKNENNYIQKQN